MMTAGGSVAIGVDVGGTKILAGVVDDSGHVLSRQRIPTPVLADDRIDAIIDLVGSLCAEHGLEGAPVGVGAAGLVSLDGVVLYAPNLDWRDAPVRLQLADRLHVPVRVENDATAATWGEFVAGAARRASGGALMLTLGTGVGGGLVMDGRLIRGATGVAAEFGHLIVCEGGALCPCGNRGCLEALASGSAIERTAREAVRGRTLPDGSPLYDVQQLTGRDVSRAALAGDDGATALLATAGTWLGVGIASLVNGLDPEVVVLGGGVTAIGDLLLRPAIDAYHDRVIARAHRIVPPVVRAQLENDAGIVGAALLAAANAGS